MERKVKKTIWKIVSFIIGLAIGALIVWQYKTIEKKNAEIATLKEELSQAQTLNLKFMLRFGQWKLQIEELAKENGWELPELSDSDTLIIPGPKFEGNLKADIVGDSIVVREKTIKIAEK